MWSCLVSAAVTRASHRDVTRLVPPRRPQEDIANLRAGLKDRNDREWMRIFKRPLQAAKRELRAEAKSAWSSFLLRRTVRRLAAAHASAIGAATSY